MTGLVIIAVTIASALLAPYLTGYDPNKQLFDGLTLEGAPLPPSATFWLGTDLLGRDLLTRILYGARTSLIIGIVANGAALLIGTLSASSPATSAAGSAAR
jgi:peptide/nickel transport system permease protein